MEKFMNPTKIRFNLFVILFPLVILFFAGGYSTYSTWFKYTNISELQNRLSKIALLQSLEGAISQELICTTKISGERKLLKDQCREQRIATDDIVQKLAQQSNSFAFYQRVNNIFTDANQSAESQMISFGKVGLANTLQNIRYNIDTSQELQIEALINSEYHTKILAPIKTYFKEVDKYGDASNKPYIQFFTSINTLYFHSVTQTIFSTYFLANKKNFSSVDLMHWDDYMVLAIVPNMDNYSNIDPIKKDLNSIFASQHSKELLDKLDTMSIEILQGYATGQYDIDPKEWISLNEKKQNLFMMAETKTLEDITDKNQQITKRYKLIIFGSIAISLLSMIVFIFLIRKYMERLKEEDKALAKMMHEIEILTTESQKEVLSSKNLLSDLSDKKQIYIYISSILELLHEKEMQAGEANSAKDLFLANMSHEIRTPLNGIVGFTQLLKESKLSEDQREFISIIENSSDNLLTIVNDILDISKISADKMELEQVSFDLFERAESAIETFAAKADENRINLGIFIDPALPKNVIGDPTKLSQVMTNLISNALKFTPKDGFIDLSIERSEEKYPSSSDVMIRFAVKDSGIGITKEQKNKIFQAFTQADSSTSRKFGGTGLGLTISQAILHYMGGELDLHSKEGEGAEFFFTIPFEQDTQTQPFVYPNYSNLSIGLIVTDVNQLNQLEHNLQRYIRALGCELIFYTYTDLFDKNKEVEAPNILFIDNSHVKNVNALKIFANIDTHLIVMSTGSFKNTLDANDHSFMKIIYKPMTLSKTIRAIESCVSEGKVVPIEKQTALKTDRFQNIRALVAEDNEINQKLILVTLENFGLKVTLTSNGKEALHKRQSEDYDIIFMDVQMPVMNGMEATRAILEYEKEYNEPHIPIIALTANALKGDKEKYIVAGMDNYASKPLDLVELKSIIGEYFPEKSVTQEQEKLSPVVEKAVEKPADSEKPIDNEPHSTPDSPAMPKAPAPKESDKPITILLYNEISLQSNIYKSIFKGLGYEVDIARSDNDFLDALENKEYTYAMYDASSFHNMACSVADIAKDAHIIPIMFVEEKPEPNFCTKTLMINSDRDTIKEMLEKR